MKIIAKLAFALLTLLGTRVSNHVKKMYKNVIVQKRHSAPVNKNKRFAMN